MRFKDTTKTAVQSLITHKGRSVLTVLGVVIGVSAIMIVMSIGNSAQALITKEIQSFGPENVFINPGKPSDGLFSFSGQSSAILMRSLTNKDLEDLKKKSNVPDAVIVNPAVNGSFTVSYDSETKTVSTIGMGAEGFKIYNISAGSGRLFTEDEVNSKATVVVIGRNLVKDLFNNQNPIGEKIKIKEKKFTVVGVFSYAGSSMFGIDDLIAIPYTTMQQNLLGIRHFHEIAVRANSASSVQRMVKDIKFTLRENHDIEDPSKDDFIISTQEDIIKTVDQILGAITVFLMFVAGISLVVGGIGVMNIMFVSVTERTREIGLRKSLGATNKNILVQFLLEAIMLTGGGGIIGVFSGTVITFLITFVASFITNINFPYSFSVTGTVLGILVSCGTGLLFGIFPAHQASKKSPMEALRYE